MLGLLAVAGTAHADGDVTPRSIGRAGATLVADDGAGALFSNPAALARRSGTRAELGTILVDDDLSWAPDVPGAPRARDQAPARFVPAAAAFASLGHWVIGAGLATSVRARRALRPPADVPPADYGVAFEYRYLGIAGRLQRHTVGAGAARRLGESVALGLTLSATRVSLDETRRVWAGFAGRDVIGDPVADLELAFTGRDRFVPGAVAGILIAPDGTPFELGASAAYSAGASIDANVSGSRTNEQGPALQGSNAARLAVRAPVQLRAGVRYVGDRFVVEIDGELARFAAGAATASWDVLDARVIDATGMSAPLGGVPSRLSQRTHGAVRGAVDVEVLPGFLRATAGYGWARSGTSSAHLSPTFGDLGGHTAALGVELESGNVTFGLGWARTWSISRDGGTVLRLDNPFGAGDGAAALGRYDASSDRIGLFLGAAL
jgi:hypothetical protein